MWITKEAALCHATATALARNDRKTPLVKKVDSSTAQIPSLRGGGEATNEAIHNKNTQKVDSRICDEKAGLCSGEQGDKTRGLSPQRATNSLLYRAKPNP